MSSFLERLWKRFPRDTAQFCPGIPAGGEQMKAFGYIFRNRTFLVAGPFLLATLAGLGLIALPRALSQSAPGTGDAALLDGFRHTEVASVSDALEKVSGQRMYMSHRMRPLFPSKLARLAVTAKLKKEETRDADAQTGMLAAIDQGGPKSVDERD